MNFEGSKTEIFCKISSKKVKGGRWDYRIISKILNERGRIKKISIKPNSEQIVSICKGKKYHLVYEDGKLVHADVEETKTRQKRKIIENGDIVPPLRSIYERIKTQNISDEEKIMVLDAILRNLNEESFI